MRNNAYFAALREQLQIDLSDADFLDGWNALFLEPLSGMTELLPLLARRWPLYLFSNTNRLHYEYWGVRYRPLLTHFSGVFCSHDVNPLAADGLIYGNAGQLLAQFEGVVITILIAAVFTFLILKGINLFVKLRVNEEEEKFGMDYSEHGENAYSTM